MGDQRLQFRVLVQHVEVVIELRDDPEGDEVLDQFLDTALAQIGKVPHVDELHQVEDEEVDHTDQESPLGKFKMICVERHILHHLEPVADL